MKSMGYLLQWMFHGNIETNLEIDPYCTRKPNSVMIMQSVLRKGARSIISLLLLSWCHDGCCQCNECLVVYGTILTAACEMGRRFGIRLEMCIGGVEGLAITGPQIHIDRSDDGIAIIQKIEVMERDGEKKQYCNHYQAGGAQALRNAENTFGSPSWPFCEQEMLGWLLGQKNVEDCCVMLAVVFALTG